MFYCPGEYTQREREKRRDTARNLPKNNDHSSAPVWQQRSRSRNIINGALTLTPLVQAKTRWNERVRNEPNWRMMWGSKQPEKEEEFKEFRVPLTNTQDRRSGAPPTVEKKNMKSKFHLASVILVRCLFIQWIMGKCLFLSAIQWNSTLQSSIFSSPFLPPLSLPCPRQ